MPIVPLPSISRSDANFRTQVDDYFLTRLPAFSTQAESARVQIVAAESTATSAASTAATAATTATTAAGTATSASASAVTAKNAAELAAAQAISGNVATPIHAATAKSPPADADELGITDSAASWGLKKLTFANLKAWVGSLFVSKSGDTINGDLNFSGAGRRITGDFSNATVANRTLFQTRVANDATDLTIVPNGTATYAAVSARSSDSENASVVSLAVNVAGGVAELWSGGTGSGVYLPLRFIVGGAERLRIDQTTGNILATGGGGLGYGVGSGGSATQGTSKSTTVTLNKPSGLITTHNASLAAGAEVQFVVNNSLATDKDIVVANQSTFALNTANYQIRIAAVANGAFVISLKNITGISLSEAVPITFAIQKGAAS